MKITERLRADMEKDDDKFVRAVADKGAREERLKQLSATRLRIQKLLLIYFVLFFLASMLDFARIFFSNENADQLSRGAITVGGLALFS